MTSYWIQEAVLRRPHRVREYMARHYGAQAFKGGDEIRGKILPSYFHKAWNHIKNEAGHLDEKRAFRLADRFINHDFRHRG